MLLHLAGAIAVASAEVCKRQGALGGYCGDKSSERFRQQRLYIQRNLKCIVKYLESVIPAKGGKISDVIILSAKETIEYSGMFMLMKGLPQVSKVKKEVDEEDEEEEAIEVERRRRRRQSSVTTVKFIVLGSMLREDSSFVKIEKDSMEKYPVELDIPEKLPPPLITSGGKLFYKLHVFVSTTEGRHVSVGEVAIRWQGCRVLTWEEVEMPLRLEQEVMTKRNYGGLGRRRKCGIEWRTDKGAYLPGEVIHVEMVGETRSKMGFGVECKVELVQKVWYQEPSICSVGRMCVQMKVNVLAGVGTAAGESAEVDGGGEKNLVWRGRLKVPRGITPTFKVDFTNSVSYTIRMSVGVAGESKEGRVTGELPLLIGSSKIILGENGEEIEVEAEGERQVEEKSETCDWATSPPVFPNIFHNDHPKSNDNSSRPRSRSMSSSTLPPVMSMSRRRESSINAVHLPPSYSQLSSRIPSLETLPPAYSTLGFPERIQPFSHSSQEEYLDEVDSCYISMATKTDYIKK